MERTGLVLLLVASLGCGLVFAQYDIHEGSECTLKNGGKGVCALLTNCAPAAQALRSGERPVTCSYNGFTPVVCCSQAPPSTVNSSAAEEPVTQPPTTKPTTKAPANAGAISERKCIEYGKSVFRLQWGPLPGKKDNVSLCLDSGAVPFVLGGTPAVAMEYPHAAIIGYDTKSGKSWLCGGTLISERFVLTAAHCLEDHTKEGASEAKYVRLGEVALDDDNESDIQDFGVKSFIMHPDYHPPLKYNDIGLIELDRDAEFDAYVRPACLQTSRDYFPEEAIVIGWGKIYAWQFKLENTGSWAPKLQKAPLKRSAFDYCKGKYDGLSRSQTNKVLPRGIIDDTMLCFGDEKGIKDACQGDSGGPLQYLRSSPYCMYNILGITSFGNRCGKPDFPAIYTRVSHFIPWIESIVWPNETA